MNDDDLRRIRESEEHVDERLRERRCELQQSFRKLGDLEDSLSIAWKVGLTGIIPSVAWIVRQGLRRSETSFVDGLAVVIIGMIVSPSLRLLFPLAAELALTTCFAIQ